MTRVASDPTIAMLRDTIAWATARSPFYERRMRDVDLAADDPRAILAQIAVLRRSDLEGLPKWPDSPLACAPADDCIRVHHTSGSSGSGALWVADTAEDWRAILAAWRLALGHFGVTGRDRALVCAGYGRFIGFWGLHEALVDVGALTVRCRSRHGGTGGSDRASWDHGRGRHADLRLGARRGAREREHRVRLVLTSGEPRPPAARARLLRLWGCETRDTAGMTEVGTITAVECAEHPGVMHRLRDWAFEEVLDAESGLPAAEGASGVRVVTTLRRRAMPFVRYWTGDVVHLGAVDCAATQDRTSTCTASRAGSTTW